MNDQKYDFHEPEIYSITGFKDILASPLFYPIVAVSVILGIASMFGFLQNPLKLKAVVNSIHNKVSISRPLKKRNYQNQSFNNDTAYKIERENIDKENDRENIDIHSISYPEVNTNTPENNAEAALSHEKSSSKEAQQQSIEKQQSPQANDLNSLTFNYDISSHDMMVHDFWVDLDAAYLDASSITEENNTTDTPESALIGVPLEIKYYQQPELEKTPLNDSIYSLNTSSVSI